MSWRDTISAPSETAGLTKPSWRDTVKPPPPDDLSGFGEATIQQAPGLGMMAGGTIGGVVGGPPGAVLGAGIGGYTGAAAKNLYNHYKHPQLAPKTNIDYIDNPVKEGLESAALEAGGAAVINKLHPVGKYIHNRMKEGAERLAFRATGPFKRQVSQNKDRIKEVGRTALDHGVVKIEGWPSKNYGPIPVGATAETMEGRAKAALEDQGEKLGELVDDLLKIEKQTKSKFTSGNTKVLGDYLRDKLLIKDPMNIPGIESRNAKFSEMIDQVTDRGNRLNFEKIRKMKVMLGDKENGLIKWDRLPHADIPEMEQFYRTLYTALKETEEHGAGILDKLYHGEGSSRFKDAKKTYGNLKEVEKITENRANAQRANQIMGLKSAVYGAAGSQLGGTIGHKVAGTPGAIAGAFVGGSVGSIGNHLAKNYGSQFSAVILDKAAKLIARSPNLLETSQKYPSFLPYLLKSLQQKEDQKNVLP